MGGEATAVEFWVQSTMGGKGMLIIGSETRTIPASIYSYLLRSTIFVTQS